MDDFNILVDDFILFVSVGDKIIYNIRKDKQIINRQVTDVYNKGDVTFTAESLEFYPFHTSKELRILYVLKGEIEICNVSGNTRLKQGDAEFVNVNEPAQINAVTEDNVVITMHISRDYMLRFDKRIDTTTYNVSSAQFYPCDGRNTSEQNLRNKERFIRLFKELFQDYCKYGYILTENLTVLVSMIVKYFNDVNKHIYYLNNADAHVIERFVNIESYIIENLDKKSVSKTSLLLNI